MTAARSIQAELGFAVSVAPADRTTVGMSSGGICAFVAAWFKPAVFGNVVSHCGTFVDQQPVRGYWRGEHEKPLPVPNTTAHLDEGRFCGQPSGAMMPYMVRATERKPIKVWMSSRAGDVVIFMATGRSQTS